MQFDNFGLNKSILTAIKRSGYTTPSPIQQKAIPIILKGHDLLAEAQTGTGKTAAFALPILQALSGSEKKTKANCAKVLVLTPTRELAAQVKESFETYGQELGLKILVVFGGVKINPQMMALRKGADVLVATPGRLLDLHQQNAVRFDSLNCLVLDEADRMLDMGFIHDIRRVLRLLPRKKQTLLFSATFSPAIRQLTKELLESPKEVSVAKKNSTAQTVHQLIHPVDKKRKAALLITLIQEQAWDRVLVFTKTKHGANKLCRLLENAKISAMPIHGNKSQNARTKALAAFKQGEVQVLVATDIAARGLDIEQLPQVVNFDLPQVSEDYVHRIGRTGRAGERGRAISLVSADEHPLLTAIERLIKKAIPRKLVDGFEPTHDVPTSNKEKPKKAPLNKPKPRKKPGKTRRYE